MKLKRSSIFMIFAAVLLLAGGAWVYLKDRAGHYECSFGESEYASVLQWDGIVYEQNWDSPLTGLHKGKLVGEITYTTADHKCPRTVMQDGDATLLDVGTQLYEVTGYKASARLWAGDRLYDAHSNPAAKTLNDLLDIAGKIENVRFISGMDGTTHLMDFTPEAAGIFIREFPKLKYLPFQELYKQTKGWVGDNYWLEIEMKDGSTMNILYNTLSPSFNPPAYATPELAALVEQQRKLIYTK
ncbi:hypothetical protein [Paenibacillus tianjinensis]|uniref:Uncharacterized protein n=1 Tax=Paenibacillus tianjinensis TaxID=2810347 RepID=A0ABX7LAZ9_9BACL|nr:hypothetical protein [Paenibacillus tianjinensis]QSF43948.1 hypothetical protein JRJ22_22310 [Paenibacillus tianjinensis]